MKNAWDYLRDWRWRKVIETGKPAFQFLYDKELDNLARLAETCAKEGREPTLAALYQSLRKGTYAKELIEVLNKVVAERRPALSPTHDNTCEGDDVEKAVESGVEPS